MRRYGLGAIVASVVSAIPDFALAATFLITWISPTRLGERMVPHLVLVMLLEFIIIHSSAFMGNVAISEMTRLKKTGAILGLGAFYSLFAGGFSLAFRSPWPLVAFWGLTLNRLLRAILGGALGKVEKTLMTMEWVSTTVFYLLFVFLTVLLPVPRFGIRFPLEGVGEGLWIDEPQRVMAFGFLYFTALGILNVSTFRWLPGKSE